MVFLNIKVVYLVWMRFFVCYYPFHGVGKYVGYLRYLLPKINYVEVLKIDELQYRLHVIRRIIKELYQKLLKTLFSSLYKFRIIPLFK